MLTAEAVKSIDGTTPIGRREQAAPRAAGICSILALTAERTLLHAHFPARTP
jgi:hypothetical protein